MLFQWHPEGQLGKNYQCAGYTRTVHHWSFGACHVWGSVLMTEREQDMPCAWTSSEPSRGGRDISWPQTTVLPSTLRIELGHAEGAPRSKEDSALQMWKHFTSVIIPFIQLKKLRCSVATWLPQHHTSDRGIAWALTPGFLTLRALFGFHPQFYFSVTKCDSFFNSPATDHLEGSCLSNLLENSQFSKLKI